MFEFFHSHLLGEQPTSCCRCPNPLSSFRLHSVHASFRLTGAHTLTLQSATLEAQGMRRFNRQGNMNGQKEQEAQRRCKFNF